MQESTDLTSQNSLRMLCCERNKQGSVPVTWMHFQHSRCCIENINVLEGRSNSNNKILSSPSEGDIGLFICPSLYQQGALTPEGDTSAGIAVAKTQDRKTRKKSRLFQYNQSMYDARTKALKWMKIVKVETLKNTLYCSIERSRFRDQCRTSREVIVYGILVPNQWPFA